MKTRILSIVVLSLALPDWPALSQAAPPAIDRQAALDGLVAAEKAFSKAAAEKGIRDSFLEFMADDGVMFRPDPVNAKESMRARPAIPGLLSWYPAYAEVSLAGDLGYDTGPAEYRAQPEDKPDQSQFATVWKRQADGSWKAAVDLGTDENPPIPVAISLQGPAKVEESALPKVDAEALKASVLDADRAFARAGREQGSAAAYVPLLTDDVRLLRSGRALIAGRQAALEALAGDKAPATWEPAGGGVARSGDLGYTYGVVQKRETGAAGPWVKEGNYLRVWRRQADGSWRLAFDVLSLRPKPAPPKPAEEKKPTDGR
jgi:ketosteroid isomerase-like protein